MGKPFKFRNKTSGEIIEFDWNEPEPPTKFDIDRIVSERKSKQFEPPVIEPPESLISTPRFPTRPSAQLPNLDPPVDEPTFRTEVFGDYLLPEPYPKRTFDEPPSFKSEAKKGWNLATTPLFPEAEEALFSTIGKYDPTGIAEPVTRFIGGGATSPLGLFTGGLGSLAALKGGKLLGKAAKYLKDADELEDIAPPPKPISQSLSHAVPNMPVSDVAAGTDVLPEMAATVSVNPKPIRNLTAQLPHELRGAKPRYNIGTTSYEPKFENDIDKALFIVSQEKPSKRNADYMKFVMDSTGMSADEAMMAGKAVRSQLGTVLKGQKLGVNKIPRLYNPQDISPLPTPLQVEREVTLGPFPPGENTLSKVNKGAKIDPLSDVSDNLNPPEMNPAMISEEGKVIANDLRQSIRGKDRTTVPVTGNEVEPISPLAQKAAEQKLPDIPVAPSAQAEQSINEFVPKSPEEALKLADDAELRMVKAGKKPDEARRIAGEILNFPKSMWASLDLSAPLRQGKGLIYRPEYYSSLSDMLKAGWSEKGAFEIETRIRNKPLFLDGTMQKFNPGLVGLKKGTKALEDREEAIMSTWAENIPSLKSTIKAIASRDKSKLEPGLIHATNRAYTGFLNSLRADTFENMIYNYEKMGLKPRENEKLLDSTAKFIASATGRGDIGKLNAIGAELNGIVFSPKFVKSRFDMMLKPAFSSMPNQTKKEYIKSNLAVTGWWAGWATAAKIAGADIEMDMTSSDFGKIKIGNTRVDTMAGLQQPMVATIRFLSGITTSPTTGTRTIAGEGYRANTRVDTAKNFARTKLSPFAAFTYDLAEGRTITGKKTSEEIARFDKNNYFLRMLTPNMISTMADLYQEDPKWMMTLGIPAMFGESVQVFDPPPQQKTRRPSPTPTRRPIYRK